MNWEEVLTWQAEVTDAIDREEEEIMAYKAIERVLLVRRDQARQLERAFELKEIDTYLATIQLLVKMKQLLIKQWEAQFRVIAHGICS